MTISTGRHLNFILANAFVGGGVACAATASVFVDGGSPLILLSYVKFSQTDIQKNLPLQCKIIFTLVFREQFTTRDMRNYFKNALAWRSLRSIHLPAAAPFRLPKLQPNR